jgi:hypothetical protein
MPENWKTYKLEDALDALIDYRGKTPKKTGFVVPLVTAKIVKEGRILEPKEFYLGVANEWCDGELEGKVTINKQGLGIFNSEGCENLMFQFEKGGVQVTEGESCDYHGARCSFEEFYEKGGVPI